MRLTAHRLRSQHLLHHKGHLKGGKKKYNETESYLNQLNNLINASRSDIKKRKKEKRKKKNTPQSNISIKKEPHSNSNHSKNSILSMVIGRLIAQPSDPI
jgi:hypothetical protein